jgi:hypothetical protein
MGSRQKGSQATRTLTEIRISWNSLLIRVLDFSWTVTLAAERLLLARGLSAGLGPVPATGYKSVAYSMPSHGKKATACLPKMVYCPACFACRSIREQGLRDDPAEIDAAREDLKALTKPVAWLS